MRKVTLHTAKPSTRHFDEKRISLDEHLFRKFYAKMKDNEDVVIYVSDENNEERVFVTLFRNYKKITKLYEVSPGRWSKSPVVGNFNSGFPAVARPGEYTYIPHVMNVTVAVSNPKVIYVVQF